MLTLCYTHSSALPPDIYWNERTFYVRERKPQLLSARGKLHPPVLSEKYSLHNFVPREGNQLSLKRHFSISRPGLGKTWATTSAQHPLLAHLCSNTAWSGLEALVWFPLKGRAHRYCWLLKSVGNSFSGNQSFTWLHRAAFHSESFLGTSLGLQVPFATSFPYIRSSKHSKDCSCLHLSLEEEAWHEVWTHTNLDLNWGPSTCSSASYLNFRIPTVFILKVEMFLFSL